MIVIRPRIIADQAGDPTAGIMATVFMMEYIRANLFTPGQVENWIQIIDLDSLSLLNVPFKVTIPYSYKFVAIESVPRYSADLVSLHRSECLHLERVDPVPLYLADHQGFP